MTPNDAVKVLRDAMKRIALLGDGDGTSITALDATENIEQDDHSNSIEFGGIRTDLKRCNSTRLESPISNIEQDEPVAWINTKYKTLHFAGSLTDCADVTELKPLCATPQPAPQPAGKNDASVDAIQYALSDECGDGLQFLHYWNEGEFDIIRRNWANVPDAVFIGADPLMKIAAHESPSKSQLTDEEMLWMDKLYAIAYQEEVIGYVMRHKLGGDKGWSWTKENPLFSEDWIRIPAILQSSERDNGHVEALYSAVSAIYFDDSSDFKFALLAVVKALAPELMDELGSNPNAVFEKVRSSFAAIATSATKGGV